MSFAVAREDRFLPPPLLRHAHAQSILANLGLRNHFGRRHAAAMLDASVPEILDVGGVRLLGYRSGHDSAPASMPPFRTGRHTGDAATVRGREGPRKLLIVLHGWEGSADSHYVVALAGEAFAAGFDVFRLNLRDHGGTAALNEGLFHSCRLEEVAAAVGLLARGNAPGATCLAGFSLGGNFALRVAAHQEASRQLAKVVAVCPVLNPPATMRALEQGLWLYRSHFLRRFRRSLLAKAAAFPQVYEFGDLRRMRTLTETTAFFIERYTTFPDLQAYLRGYSLLGDTLAGLRVPCWLLASRDDPVIPSVDLGRLAKSDALEIAVMDHGGHCGFLEDLRLRSWLERRILAALPSL